ncbi:MAG: acetate--CoA ligase family protein, partial [Kiritimatiellae bacterium]|nr:acetate--CoA ligase family protein [Kiritimatiellia bacterium]
MMKALLNPEKIAVIGASKTPEKVGHEILSNLIDGRFKGEIVPVNPTTDKVLGLKCYPDLKAYGGNIDLSIIVIPTMAVKSAVEESLAANAKAICVISAGFKEIGKEGEALEIELAELCAAKGARLLGPNCLGLINTHHSMNASFATHMPMCGGISVISQSGALCTAILDWAASRHLGLSKMVSMGNKADLSETDFITELRHDDDTSVIVGYLESIDSGKEFIEAAKETAPIKPIVILKSGVTKAGGKAASSHTGSLAGADVAYDAAFLRSGVIRAATFEELFDYATAFSMQPLPQGRKVAIITNAGGPGIMAADAVELAGMEVCALAGSSATALREKLPAAASVGNPIDVLGDADSGRYVDAVEAAQGDDAVDAIIVLLTPQAMTKPAETARAIAECTNQKKPILVSFMGGADVMPGRDELVASNLPDYPSPERAVGALRAMCQYAEWLKLPKREIKSFDVDKKEVAKIIKSHAADGKNQIGEAAAKEIFSAYGINIPAGGSATTADEAVALAEGIGYPVVMKIASADVLHKSDMGGVKLNLGSADEVRDTYEGMMESIQHLLPEAKLDGVYIETMCREGREVIIGMTRDPQFGPLLMFGLGGIFVEVMKDVAFRLAPLTETEAMDMLKSTKSFALLEGVRGQAGVNIPAIINVIQRVSQLVTDFPVIAEMDI